MNWTNFVTYGDAPTQAFETLCNQLFERYLRRTYKEDLVKFRAINGAGGDGGIEAYGQLKDSRLIAVQSKWFRSGMQDSQIGQIRKSIKTAMSLRPTIREYIICIPRDLNAIKFVRGKKGDEKKASLNSEENLVDDLINEITQEYPSLVLTWWFDQDLLSQIQKSDNDGVHKYWFDREIVAIQHLQQQFNLQTSGWLKDRYLPELHGQGIIQASIQELLYEEQYRQILLNDLSNHTRSFFNAEKLAGDFALTLKPDDPLRILLMSIVDEIKNSIISINRVATEVSNGYEGCRSDNEEVKPIFINREVFQLINKISPNNVQLNTRERLINELNQINQHDLPALLREISNEGMQIGKLFLGDAGTGKTHALSNTVQKHLEVFAPAIIIRAKGCGPSSWLSILERGLAIPGWTLKEMLSALETLSIRADRMIASTLSEGNEAPNTTKVVICIDGLEEDIQHWDEWHNRILETNAISVDYPLIRFVFTARGYFLNDIKVKNSSKFQIINVPREGDIHVDSIKEKYFSPQHYNITIVPPLTIRGLDSLFALRLFCEENRNKTLTSADEVIVAERLLLRKKVDRLESEFSTIRGSRLSTVQTPIKSALNLISDYFYEEASIEHAQLVGILRPKLGGYLDGTEIDEVIAFLAVNGIITKSEYPSEDILSEAKILYQISYQSIMEIIMAEKITKAIVSKEIDAIPDNLITSPEFLTGEPDSSFILSQKIVENIVTTLYNEHQLMIGENGFLSDKLDSDQIEYLQFKALAKATPEAAANYKVAIKSRFLQNYKARTEILSQLIIPSANTDQSPFGAEFLDEILREFDNPFDRDKIWLGWDRHEIYAQGETEYSYYSQDPHEAIAPNDDLRALPIDAKYNELPLIYGWSLATLKQKFRAQVRFRLFEWALLRPDEFLALLQKLFSCNDPQIQEDLASIALGLASKLKDRDTILNLAIWALDNVFSNLSKYRNIIVREGFRAIVERAYQQQLITESMVKKARPKPKSEKENLQLDENVMHNPKEQIYPIVHDLAWYVIERSFNEFLDYGRDDNRPKTKHSRDFLSQVGSTFNTDWVSPHTWAMAAAISYMKNLGFNRTTGSGSTEASHGSKSDNYTLEEKYTWLAVHYIKGFLADHLPMKDTGDYASNYSQLEEIPNPAEISQDFTFTNKNILPTKWIIAESLVDEPAGAPDFDKEIKSMVDKEPDINFEKWIRPNTGVLSDRLESQSTLAIYNYTSIHDSMKYSGSRLDMRACLVKKGQSEIIKALIEQGDESLYFIEHIDSLQGMPNTSTYSNPSDVVWMNWIGEIESEVEYYDSITETEQAIYCALTKVISNTVDGEKTVIIPSIKIRELLKIVSLENGIMTDVDEMVKAIIFNNGRNANYDTQEMVLVTEHDLLKQLEAHDLEIIWFAELLTSKNALNDSIKSDNHPQKVRKYYLRMVDGQIESTKFWDYRFSNSREHLD